MRTLADFDFLRSARGTALLNQLATEDLSDQQTLSLLTRLRKAYSASQAGAALEIARLRHKAVDKFGTEAADLFFTRDALEQASDPAIRRWRSGWFDAPVLDICCGIGADSFAFASANQPVLGLDIDPLRIAIAQENAERLGLSARFAVADVRDTLPEHAENVFFDPARRDERGKRIYDVECYIPPLSLIRTWTDARIAVKLSPGVDMSQLAAYGGRVDFVSVEGDLKEAVLWPGDGDLSSRAIRIEGDTVLRWQRESRPEERPLSEPRSWLIEPDPALLRAGLVQDVAAKLDAYLLDPSIAYITSDTEPHSPWIRAWQVLDWMPFNLKKLRAYLRERGVGRVTVKKRGSPLTPEELIAKLKLKAKPGSESRTLVLTRHADQPVVMICADM